MRSQAVGEATAWFETAVEVAAQEPLAVAATLVALGVLAGTVSVYRWLTRPPGARLLAALSEPDAVTVLMHPNPDPDAMGSALGVAELADDVDTDAYIQYPGQIRHPENRAFENVLEVEFERIETAADLAAETVVLVDHNEPRGFEGAETLEPYAVVDHHPGEGEGTAFTDVRSEQGSCSSMVAAYLRDRGWRASPSADRTLPAAVATGLLYGIQADTTAFTRGCTRTEFDAAAYLYPAADPDSLDRIANPQLDTETLEVKARAIDRRELKGPFLVSHVGRLSNLDALPQAVEELVRLEGVTAAVVTGECKGDLHLSGRSRDDRVHMGKCLESIAASIPNASGGGHSRMGGGRIALPDSASGRDRHPEIRDQLFAAMNGER